MGNVTGLSRLAVVLALSFLCACAQADPVRVRFDIAAQPAASALNEFARQADVVLIFSYDSVSGVRTQSLRGLFPVDEGLGRLLRGTRLTYGRSRGGTYLICPSDACGLPVESVDAGKEPNPPRWQWRKPFAGPSP